MQMTEFKKNLDKFELDMLMLDYQKKIKQAESLGDSVLANQLVKECFQKAKEFGWRL